MHKRPAHYQLKECHYLGGDKGGGGSRQTVPKCDKGEGGSKIGFRPVTHFLNVPLCLPICGPSFSFLTSLMTGLREFGHFEPSVFLFLKITVLRGINPDVVNVLQPSIETMIFKSNFLP